jgi:hypothetical protein
MVKCPACGAEGPDDGKFCGGCGKPLPAAQEPVVARCPACNADTAPGSTFCGHCGASLAKEQPSEAAASPSPEGSPSACSRCGAATVTEAIFCGTCGADLRNRGAAAGGPAALSPAVSRYLAVLDGRLASAGFEPAGNSPILGLERSLRRKKFQLLQVGMVTTFCGVKCADFLSDTRLLDAYNKSLFDHALRNKGFFARNAFQSVLVYQVIITEGAGPEVQRYLDSYWPKHWMAFEFPVVVDIGANRILSHSGTPIWGLAFHGAFKKEAATLFSPA